MERFIYLVRHGETEFEGEKRYIGHTDCSLSHRGIERIKRLKDVLSKTSVDSVFSSDLLRARQTAKILFPNIKPIIMTELREINMGEWDGLTFKEVKEKYPKMFEERIYQIGDFVVPGGETFRQCQKRAFKAIDKIISMTDRNVLICGHAGFFRVLIAAYLNMELNHIFKIKQDYGCINILKIGETVSIEGINLKEVRSEYNGDNIL
jgi:alpha-ribazole phosphatase